MQSIDFQITLVSVSNATIFMRIQRDIALFLEGAEAEHEKNVWQN